MAHFFAGYHFDLDKTVYIFSSGRYEFQNKGFNLFIESLARLNARLMQSETDIKVVAFIITRAATHGIKVDVLKSRIMFNEIREACSSMSDQMGQSLLKAAVRGRLPTTEELIDETFQMHLKRLNHAWKRNGNPPNVTHDLVFKGEDPILNQINICKLMNQPENPVKVIYHPEFLSSTSPLFGLDYDQFVRGCHLGVFPSFYEPWGYTPMECAVMGIPSITSDLAGFATYIQSHLPDHEQNGLFVVPRNGLSFNESAEKLTDAMEKIIRSNRHERIELRNRVESTSDQFDWRNLYKYYLDAEMAAIKKYNETDHEGPLMN
jgi:glycogen(starch) synthase